MGPALDSLEVKLSGCKTSYSWRLAKLRKKWAELKASEDHSCHCGQVVAALGS